MRLWEVTQKIGKWIVNLVSIDALAEFPQRTLENSMELLGPLSVNPLLLVEQRFTCARNKNNTNLQWSQRLNKRLLKVFSESSDISFQQSFRSFPARCTGAAINRGGRI